MSLLRDYPDDFIGFASLSMPGETGNKKIIKEHMIEEPYTGINLELELDSQPWELDDENIFQHMIFTRIKIFLLLSIFSKCSIRDNRLNKILHENAKKVFNI